MITLLFQMTGLPLHGALLTGNIPATTSAEGAAFTTSSRISRIKKKIKKIL